MTEHIGYSSFDSQRDLCDWCKETVSRRGLGRVFHRRRCVAPGAVGVAVEPPVAVVEPPTSEEPLDDLLELTGEKDMTKEEAMRYAARLIRDEAVPANQKGPLLSAMARVAGWETAPEYDFEKERGKWMANFEKMVKSHVGLEAGLRELLAKYPSSAVELKGVLGG